MLTVIFLVPVVLILVGFFVWVVGFGKGRKNQSGESEVRAQEMNTQNDRRSS